MTNDDELMEFPEAVVEPVAKLQIARSEKIGQLVKALAAATLKFTPVVKEQVNPYYRSKYADLAAVIGATAVALAENELVIIQLPKTATAPDKDEIREAGVTTLLAHGSDEWIGVELLLPVARADAQGIGSAITFSRRYSEQSVINVAGELDDDANTTLSEEQRKKLEQMPRPSQQELLGPEQLKRGRPRKDKDKQGAKPPSWAQEFWYYARTVRFLHIQNPDPEIRQYIEKTLGVTSTSDIPEDKREAAMAWAKQSGMPEPTNNEAPPTTR